MITGLLNIDWEKVFRFLDTVDWVKLFTTGFWIGVTYGFIILFSFLYAILKSKIWWDENFFRVHITKLINRNIPIDYDEGTCCYFMRYIGFYFQRIVFRKIDNDCRILIEGNPVGYLFSLFGNSEFNLNLEKEEDNNFFNMIHSHSGYTPPGEKEVIDYSECVPWIHEQFKKYGYYSHLNEKRERDAQED